MYKFFNWIKRVVLGWYNYLFKNPNEETLRRRKICENCEFRKRIGNTYYCSICYCPIVSKTASPEEKCLNGKW